MKEKKVIPIDAPGIVEKVEAVLWKTPDEHFYHSEASARWDACTHVYCDCGALTEKLYTKCEKCRQAKADDYWKSLPRKKIGEMEDGELIGSDLFEDKCPIGDINDIAEWLSDFNLEERDPDIDPDPLTLQDLRLEIWRPIYLEEIDPDQFSNLEDAYEDFELPKDSPILKAIDELNRAIAESKTIIGYEATKYALDLDE